MTARARALATVWATFWKHVEDGGHKMQDQPGYLAIGLEPIDEALREALAKAFDEGVLNGLQAALAAQERRN